MPTYDTSDTIVAVSSGLSGIRKIIRISGPKAFEVVSKMTKGKFSAFQRKIYNVHLRISDDLYLHAELIVFKSPNSYTGDNLIEIHIDCAVVAVEQLIAEITSSGVRLAEPGEFTARAFLNGKIGLAQAEAVAQIVSAGSQIKLNAAQKLLAGRLSQSVGNIRGKLLDIMSLIEAGLDFSDQNIEIVSKHKALHDIAEIRDGLQNLIDGCIYYEAVIDMPSVGIAGASNAGKSSLTNTLLGWQRSIVSSEKATTRDVLSGRLELEHNSCLLFDCAGLVPDSKNILDELALQAAIEAIHGASIMMFCIEACKDDYSDDIKALQLVMENFTGPMICVVTKYDQIQEHGDAVSPKLPDIHTDTIFTSSQTGIGIGSLKNRIDELLGQTMFAGGESSDAIAINQRHFETTNEAVGNVKKAHKEIVSDNEELAAMFLRSAYEALAGIENESVDEQMLNRIFSSFCIGK
jgi:tRNA modification GTPase